MSLMMHASLSVRGALRWPKSQLRGLFRDSDGRLTTAAESRDRLLDLLSQGVELLPLGQCEGHDPKNGCPGHQEAV